MRYLVCRVDFDEDSGNFFDQQGVLEFNNAGVVRTDADVNRGAYASSAAGGVTAVTTSAHIISYERYPGSIYVRFKCDPSTSQRALVASGRLGYNDLGYYLGVMPSSHGTYPNKLIFSAEEGPGPAAGYEKTIYSTSAVTDGAWHDAVMTWDNGEWNLFIDNNTPDVTIYDGLAYFDSHGESAPATWQRLLGAKEVGGGYGDGFVDGVVSKILFFCSALTTQEVNNLINYDDTFTPDSSLIHEWRLEERGATTLLGIDRIAEDHGDPDGDGPDDTVGRYYRGRSWTTTTQRLTCGNPTDLQHTTGKFAFRLWFKCTATSTSDRYLFSKIASSQIGYGLRIEASTDGTNPNGLTFVSSSNGTTETLITGTTNVCDSEWHSVVFSKNTTNGTIFLDDGTEATGSVVSSIHNSTADFVIGNTDDYNAGADDCILNYLSAFDDEVSSTGAYNLWKHHYLTIPEGPAHEWLLRQGYGLALAQYSDTGYSLDRCHVSTSPASHNSESYGMMDSVSSLVGGNSSLAIIPDQNDELHPSTESFSIVWGGYLPYYSSGVAWQFLFSNYANTGDKRSFAVLIDNSGHLASYFSSDGTSGTNQFRATSPRARVPTQGSANREDYALQDRYAQLVLTRNGTSYKLYLNGYLISDDWTSHASLFYGDDFMMINYGDGSRGLGFGAFDYTQFWLDTELTSDEVYELYYGPEEIIVSNIVVTLEDPYNNQRNVYENTNVSFRIEDITHLSGVNQGTLEVTFNGVSVISAGSLQTGYDGTIIALASAYGFDVDIDPDDFFDYCDFIHIAVNAEDNEGTAMTEHIWYFVIRCVEVGKSFLVNSGLGSINSVSSLFKEKISNITAGSKGNVSLNVTADSILSTVKDYELRVVRAGRLDKDIDTVQETTKDLGSGQISYTEARSFRGNFYPPHFVIDENTGTYPVFGYERTMSRYIGGGDYANKVSTICSCDRNNDSIFVFVLDATSSTDTFAYSHAKPGKTDASPLTGTTISDFLIYSAVRITDNNYLLVSIDGYLSGDDLYMKSVIVNSNASLVETLDNFILAVKDPTATNPTISSIDLYSDMTGNIYGVVDYISDTTALYDTKPIFFRSYNNGRTWEIMKEPGTDVNVDIGNPLLDIGFNPKDTNNGRGYNGSRLYWDDVNEEFILTIAGLVYNGSNTMTRYTTMTSKDFKIWNRMNLPIFKSDVAETFNSDFNSVIPSYPAAYGNLYSRFVRLGDKLFSIASEYLTQQYTCIFPNEEEPYGSRFGYFWSGDNTAAPNDGVQIRQFDLKKIDGVVYLTSVHYNTSNVKGYVINALGTLTNIPDMAFYNGAWFGVTCTPDNNHGWTRNATGSPTETTANTGLTLSGSTGNYVNYNRTPTVSSTVLNTFKFSVKPVTDSGPSTASAQGIRIVVDGATTQVDFTVRVSTTGLYFRDNVSTYNTTLSDTFNDFVDIIIAHTTDSLRVFYKTGNEYEDRWDLFVERSTNLGNSALTEDYKFGILSDPGASTQAEWRYFFYRDNRLVTKNADIFLEDNLVNFNSVIYDLELDSIPMNIANEHQQSIDNISLIWRGMDSFEDDSWSFTIDSDFAAANVFLKSPSVVYHTANTSSDQNFVIDADDDDLSSYIFDVFMFLNTNARYIKVQANDTDVWTSPSYEKQLDFTYDTGTIAADSLRTDSDLLVVRMTGKSYLQSELENKYIMLEKILEPGAPSDNTYGNVAFKILENGPDYVVISTKGLTYDEAAGGGTYTAMKVVSGDDFVIYDTQVADYEIDIQNYRFIRVLIEASDAYGTAWTSTNQPNLPNERTWQIGEFDIGIRVYLTEDVSYPYNEGIDSNVTSKENDYGQITFSKHGKSVRNFSLSYKVLSDEDYRAVLGLYNSAAEAGEPFWYMPNIVDYPTRVYLVTLKGGLKSNRMLPDYQLVKMDMDEVK